MPSKLIDQATQTESLAQSLTFTQQRHRQENLDQGEEVDSVSLSELEMIEFNKIEKILNDKFLLEIVLAKLASYQFALLMALRNRDLISEKLYNFIFFYKKKSANSRR